MYYIAATSGISALFDILLWLSGEELGPAGYAGLGVTCLIWLLGTYAASMSMTADRLSINGYLWFLFTTLVLLIPGMAGFGLILSMPSGWDRGTTFGVFLILLLVTVAALTFLPSWPILQARAQFGVAPLRVLKATKGHRWSLIVIMFAGSGINRIVPSMSDANDIGTAVLLACGNFVVNCATLMLTASAAVTAWRYAIREDPGLDQSTI